MTATSCKFFDFLNEKGIACHSPAADENAIIHELVTLAQAQYPALDADAAEREVLAREALFPTVIAPGLAVPHARIAGLEKVCVALATSEKGISFGNDPVPVQAAILVLSPADDPGAHLRVLTALSKEFSNPEKIAGLAALTRAPEVLDFFREKPFQLPDFLRVKDLMTKTVPTLLEQDTIECAIRRFAETNAEEMAVIDDDGDLRGVIALEDILRYSLPEHMLWMDDLSPIYQFQPFADMLANSSETKVADVMREEFIKVHMDIPAVQLAKIFLTNKVQELLVVDEKGRLAGAVNMRRFCARLFWE